MKLNHGLALLLAFFTFACQPAPLSTVTIIDNDQVISLQTDERVPSALLAQAGIGLAPSDRVLVNGLPVKPDQAISNPPFSNSPITIQIRRAIDITLISSEGDQQIRSSAFTIGEALMDASRWLYAGIEVGVPLTTPVSHLREQIDWDQVSNSKITIAPTHALTIIYSGKPLQINSSARTIGEALAEAGIPLLGLDYSLPSEDEPLPADGQIKVVRVSESVLLAQKPIPFESDLRASAEVPLDQTQILQPGEVGLNVERIRIRYEDGEEISRITENETMVRPPKTRVLGYGTKVEIKTAVVDGVQIEYWRAVQMYATSYSPCRSGADRCYPGTSSGKSLRKGMVAMQYSWYLAMGGQRLYVPGYGFATIEDVCGGCTGKPWIDLGYSDSDWQQWSSWVTVYFLTPVPPNVIYVLE